MLHSQDNLQSVPTGLLEEMGVFKCILIGFEVPLQAGYYKTGQKPVVMEGIGSKGETTAIIIQNGHVGTLKLPSKNSCLCT